MKKNYILLVLILLAASVTMAGKWRVNNVSGIDADFTSPQAAHDNASVLPGDTIYVEGTGVSYGSLSLTKKLVIVGPGFFLAENDSTQENPAMAILSDLYVNSGADGSLITGMTISTGLYIYANYVALKRNYQTHSGVFIYVYGSFDQIIQNYFNGGISLMNGANNYIIANNFIRGQEVFYGGSQYDHFAILSEGATSGQIYNNVFYYGCFTINNCEFKNNIRTSDYYTYNNYLNAYNSNVQNNLDAGTLFGTSNGNQANINMNNVFMCYTSCPFGVSTDERYVLKAGSPAIGAGVGGVDCGMFGGPNPYVLSGLPTFPAIWDLEVVGTNVTVKAKSH